MPGPPRPEVRRIVLHAGDLRLSALLAEPEEPPRATVVALHGSGMNCGYFHARTHPGLSLLDLGAALGHTVVAVDRPGYGESATALPDGQGVLEQAETLRLALRDLTSRYPIGAGVLLLAHSYGGKVALTAAAHGVHDRLLGLDVSGCGHRYATVPPRRPGHGSPRVNWGPPSLYPSATFTTGASVLAPVPRREREEAWRWPRDFPALAARVRVPVRLTFAEHEAWWRHDEAAVAELTMLLGAPRVLVDRQPGAGHNISLGWAARAYHLRVLGFLEECLQPGLPGAPRIGTPVPEDAARA